MHCFFEFPTVNQDEGETNVVGRLTRLLDVARKLDGAGLPMTLTMTGLAFGVEDEGEINDFLAALGIEEVVTDNRPGRTLDEVCEAVGRMHDELRGGRLDAGGRARLAALRWVLGQSLEDGGAELDLVHPQAQAGVGGLHMTTKAAACTSAGLV